MERQYSHCYAVELPRYVYIPEHDDFIDGLSINLGELALSEVEYYCLNPPCNFYKVDK